jgi:hypothetical protein
MIEGIATFTMVASTMIIETPRLSIARPSQRPRPPAIEDGAELAGIPVDIAPGAPGPVALLSFR